MGTTADKLNKVLQTKEAIRTAINNKGGTLTETDKFSDYATAIDNIQSGGSGGGGGSLKTLLDATKTCYYLFANYEGTSVDGLISYSDTSNVASMDWMFYKCLYLTTIPQLDTSNATNMNSMFYECNALKTIPQLYTSKVTDMSGMFYRCFKLTTIPQLDTSKVTDMHSMFFSCKSLTYLKLLNVKVDLQIGSGTSWGHRIEKDCLIQIISELIKPSSGTKTLTMGTANKAKIADTYVKLLEDDGTGKYPFEVCTSTDEGAMTIEAYCNSKNWTLA